MNETPAVDNAIVSKVSTPATVILVLAGITALLVLAGLLFNLLGMSAGMFEGAGDDRIAALLGGGIGITANILQLIFVGVIIFGALKMKNLQNYPLALTGTILMMIPCSCCCVVNLPVGIWGLVVLLDENVKRAFT